MTDAITSVMNLPTEILFHIFEFNLSPRNLETRTSQLLTCCLLNKSFLSAYQPKLLEHLFLKGGLGRVGVQLGAIRQLLARRGARGKQARLRVSTVTCRLSNVTSFEERNMNRKERSYLSEQVMEVVEQCENISELALHGLDVDVYSLLLNLRKCKYSRYIKTSLTLFKSQPCCPPPIILSCSPVARCRRHRLSRRRH